MTLSSHSSWFDHANNIYSQQAKSITMTTLVVMTYPILDDSYWVFCIIQWHWRKRLPCVLLNIQTPCIRISLFHRTFQFTMCNGPTNALVWNKALIQMSHIKKLKITPTCRHVDMPLHTIQHAKRMNVCCRITTHEDSNFNQWF
jgi:hypothetical protein